MLLSVILGLLLTASTTLAALFPKNSPVIQLTPANFKKEVLSIDKPVIVAATAPWCGHCKNLSPEFDKAARSLDGIVKFANLDCDAETNRPVCSQYDIKGFPTIFLFPPTKNRIPRPYQGERSAKALVDHAIGSLPHSVKKLNAEEIEPWVVEGKHVEKKASVLLFSNKPTSSPLYKSLALDFRKSMNFAFARGDQGPVQSMARVGLGVSIREDKDLPVLVVFPPRGDKSEAFQKGSFETYSGKLKYHPMKEWLDGIKEKYNIHDEAPDTKVKPRKKSTQSKASQEEPLPEGAAYEWKAAPRKGSKSDDEGKDGSHLSKERASKLAEEIKAKQDSLGKKEKGAKGDAEGMAFGERHRVKNNQKPFEAEAAAAAAARENSTAPGEGTDDATSTGDEDRASEPQTKMASDFTEEQVNIDDSAVKEEEVATPLDASNDEIPIEDQGPYIYTDSQKADLHAMNSILEEAGVYQLADEAINRVGKAASSARSNAKDVYENVKNAAEKVSGKVKDVVAGGEGGGDEQEPFDTKRRALRSAFETWLSGEQPNWEEDYKSDFQRATKDVEELLRKDPERAKKLAWESEESLLSELMADQEKMKDRLGSGKAKQLEEMIAMIQGRLESRGANGEMGRGGSLKDDRSGQSQEEVDATLKIEEVVKEGGSKGHDEL